MGMGLNLKTPPASEPVSLAEAKAHLRVTEANEDALITAFIVAARERAEAQTNRAFITQTWALFRDDFPGAAGEIRTDPRVQDREDGQHRAGREIILPRNPVQSITHLKHFDETDAETIFPASSYRLDNKREPGALVLKNDDDWPTSPELRSSNAVEVEFVAGYGDAADVPETIKVAIKLFLGHLFENREAVIVNRGALNISEVPFAFNALLDTFRVFPL